MPANETSRKGRRPHQAQTLLPIDRFNAAVKAEMERRKCSRAEAVYQVAQNDPELSRAYHDARQKAEDSEAAALVLHEHREREAKERATQAARKAETQHRKSVATIAGHLKTSTTGRATPPKSYLTSWREILLGLGMKNNMEDKGRVRHLNRQYAGPIVIPKQGAQPKVDKAKLIEWWNGLDAQWTAGYSRGRDTKPTIEPQHNYGHSGIVTPEISGGVKKRRSDRKR